jgi:hypothetical protein
MTNDSRDSHRVAHPSSTPFDWRSYATAAGIQPWQALIACQQAFRHGYPHGITVTSPTSLDRIARDDTLVDVIRATIDDAAAKTA